EQNFVEQRVIEYFNDLLPRGHKRHLRHDFSLCVLRASMHSSKTRALAASSQRGRVQTYSANLADRPWRFLTLAPALYVSREPGPEGVVAEVEPGVADGLSHHGSVGRLCQGVRGRMPARAGEMASVQRRHQVAQGVQRVIVLVEWGLALAPLALVVAVQLRLRQQVGTSPRLDVQR